MTAGSAAVPNGYTVPVTLDHASLVSTSKSLANGDDVRMVLWSPPVESLADHQLVQCFLTYYSTGQAQLVEGFACLSNEPKVYFKFTPLEVGYQRELLVNKEKFLTGQAAGLSNGVNAGSYLPTPGRRVPKLLLSPGGLCAGRANKSQFQIFKT